MPCFQCSIGNRPSRPRFKIDTLSIGMTPQNLYSPFNRFPKSMVIGVKNEMLLLVQRLHLCILFNNNRQHPTAALKSSSRFSFSFRFLDLFSLSRSPKVFPTSRDGHAHLIHSTPSSNTARTRILESRLILSAELFFRMIIIPSALFPVSTLQKRRLSPFLLPPFVLSVLSRLHLLF
jgi:hypothetical protein